MTNSPPNMHRASASPQDDKVLLQLTGLKKTYDQTEVLKDINLDIKHGEFLTLLGPSGCGKTTLLRLIAGFEQPNAGAIYLDGVQMAGLPADKRPVNTVFQQYALFPHMSVAQNVAYGLKLKKVPKDEIQTRVREMLAMVQLEHLANRRPQDLSGGQQQRVAIARAVINRPKLLLLDEHYLRSIISCACKCNLSLNGCNESLASLLYLSPTTKKKRYRCRIVSP
nr:ATP-binding cassette domain-containing protein [Psychrobacter sp. JCM 18903]